MMIYRIYLLFCMPLTGTQELILFSISPCIWNFDSIVNRSFSNNTRHAT